MKRGDLHGLFNEFVLWILPLLILTGVIFRSGIGESIQVRNVLSLVLPSCFVVLSLHLPLGYDRVTEFRSLASKSRVNARKEEEKITPEQEDIYLDPHRTNARFILRAAFLAFLSFLYPILSALDSLNLELLSSFSGRAQKFIDSFFVSVSVFISVFISYLIFDLAIEYLDYSTLEGSPAIRRNISTKCAITVLGVLEIISIAGLVTASEGFDAGIWLVSATISSALILSALLLRS